MHPSKAGKCPRIHTPLDAVLEESSEGYFNRNSTAVDTRDFETDLPSPSFSRASTAHRESDWTSHERSAKARMGSGSSRASSQEKVREHAIVKAAIFLVSVRWRGVLALIAGMFSQMLCWGLIMTYGTILAFYVRYLIPNTEELLITLAGAIPPFCLLALAVPWGRLLDAGHYRELNILAGIFLTGGMTCLAFTGDDDYNSGQYWAILLASIPMGIGQSIYFLAAPQMAKTWHPKHKGLAMGFTNCGAAVGGVAWPLVFDKLVDDHGFREGVGTLAGISGALSIFIIFFSVPAPDFKRRSIGKGNAYNFRTWWPTRAFRSKTFILHIMSMSCIYLGVLTIPFFIELWARRRQTISVSEDIGTGTGIDLDRSEKLAVFLLITLNGCQLPGRLFGSMMCDKVKARKIHVCACFTSVLIIASSWFTVESFRGGLGFAALFGLCLGVMVSLPINDMQEILGNERTYLLGQYAGAVYTCCCPFMLGGIVTAGALIQYFDVFIAPAIWTICCFSAGGVLMLIGLCIKDDTACFEELDDENQTRGSRTECGGSTRTNSLNKEEERHKAVNSRTQSELERGITGAATPSRRTKIDVPAAAKEDLQTRRRANSWSCPESPV